MIVDLFPPFFYIIIQSLDAHFLQEHCLAAKNNKKPASSVYKNNKSFRSSSFQSFIWENQFFNFLIACNRIFCLWHNEFTLFSILTLVVLYYYYYFLQFFFYFGI